MEEWRDIKGYEGLYQVSSEGRIKDCGGRKYHPLPKILKAHKNVAGYRTISLTKEKYETRYFYIHDLVAQAFIPNHDNKPFVDHINTIRSDNRVMNLRWCTQKENCNNPNSVKNYRESLKMLKSHEASALASSKPVAQFGLKGELIKVYPSITVASRETGMHRNRIGYCCNGKQHTAGGFIWHFAEKPNYPISDKDKNC